MEKLAIGTKVRVSENFDGNPLHVGIEGTIVEYIPQYEGQPEVTKWDYRLESEGRYSNGLAVFHREVEVIE